jgi:hypothetical protein
MSRCAIRPLLLALLAPVAKGSIASNGSLNAGKSLKKSVMSVPDILVVVKYLSRM